MENDIIQGSDAWFERRIGKATASKMADLMAKTKTGYSASRANYMAQLIVERLTGQKQESYTNTAMQWGTETEPQARAAYELETSNQVKEVGFIDHPVISMSGASPDGLIGDEGMLEIKCPNTATHIDFLLSGDIDGKYIKQMMWQMACTGRQWCDFVSFDPRLPVNLQIKIARVNRDEVAISEMENEVKKFLDEVSEKVKKLQEIE
jgi:putative phage-type endonuclease